MARAGAAAALVLTLLLPAVAQEAPRGFADSAEREFAIREWALEPARTRASLRRALDGTPDERASALKALARGAQFCVGDDPQRDESLAKLALAPSEWRAAPAVGAALFAALAAARVRVSEALEFESELRHPLPYVRLATVQWLAAAGELGAGPLRRAASDPDERVAGAARDALVLRLPDTADDVLEVARALRAGGDAAGWVGILARLERSALPETLIDLLERERLDRDSFAVLEALRLRRFGRGDATAIARAWPGPESFDALFTHAARTVRGTSPELGRALLAEAEGCDDAVRRRALLRGAVEALPPGEVLAIAARSPALAERAAIDLWECLRGRIDGLTREEAGPWLAASQPAELRRAAADVLQSALIDDGRADLAPLLVLALEDSDRRVVDVAFEALCDVRPVEPWLEVLERRWQRFEPDRRIAALAELPRGVRLTPFRGGLAELAAGTGAASAAAFELLAGLAPDVELAQLAARRLRSELQLLAREPSREAELRAAGLVRALYDQSAGAAVDELEVALESSRERVEVGKVAAWALGQSEAGRERLARWISPGVPSRLRIEAALMRAPLGDAAAVAALEGDWPTCDFDLKSRILRACAANGGARAVALLERVALDPGALEPHREAALDLLAECAPPRVDTLLAASDTANLDVRRHALLTLGRCGDPRALEHLRRRLGAAPSPEQTSGERIERETEREAIWTALARADALDDALVAAWLRAPLAAADEQLRARFRGEAQGGSEFSWRPELEVAAALARQRRVLPALERAGPWWRCDARLLYALGERARENGDPEAARTLYRAAGIGFLGEAPSEDREVRLFDVRQRLLEVCERLRDFGTFRELARQLLDEQRVGRGPGRAFERAFGGFDPQRGLDGVARLESALWQAAAWAEIEAGRSAEARELAAAAATRLGASQAAREAQAKLEAALAR